MLDQLTFCCVTPPSSVERRNRSGREILTEAIRIQIRLVEATRNGSFTASCPMRLARNGASPRASAATGKGFHRTWFWQDMADRQYYYQVRYANRVLDLSRVGQTTVVGGSTVDELVASLNRLKALVETGEYDDIIAKARRALSASHSAAGSG
jgi:hypothetical protein